MLDPTCPSCGSVLATAGPAEPDHGRIPMARVARARWFDRTLVAGVLAPLLAAAAKVGWSSAGAAGAAGALMLAALVAYVALAPATRGH